MQALRGKRGIALRILDPGDRRGWAINAMPWEFYLQKRDSIPIVQKAGGSSSIAA